MEKFRIFRTEKTYAVKSGKWYFEFEAVTAGDMRVGWTRPGCLPDQELGSDEEAFVFDGFKVCLCLSIIIWVIAKVNFTSYSICSSLILIAFFSFICGHWNYFSVSLKVWVEYAENQKCLNYKLMSSKELSEFIISRILFTACEKNFTNKMHVKHWKSLNQIQNTGRAVISYESFL